MKEHQVISHLLVHLVKKKSFIPSVVSARKKSQQSMIKRALTKSKIEKRLLEGIEYRTTKDDIAGHFMHGKRSKDRKLIIEAKGGSVFYNFYTMLGQLITKILSSSHYNWFAMAVPAAWEEKIKDLLTHKGKVKPIIEQIIQSHTRGGQGLWFYFVESDGTVYRKTWKQVLK